MNLNHRQRRVFAQIADGEMHVTDIATKSSMTGREALAVFRELEAAGLIVVFDMKAALTEDGIRELDEDR